MMSRWFFMVGSLLLLALPLLDGRPAHLAFLSDAGIFLLLAFGLNVVVGFAGLLDLGYAAFFAIGSYTYAFLASAQFHLHTPFLLTILAAVVITALFGIVLGAPTLRLRGDYLAIVTLGFGEIVPQTFLNLSAYTNGPNGIVALDFPQLFGRSFGLHPMPYYMTILLALGLVVLLVRNLLASRIGRAWAAIREDELAAAYMGIDRTTTKLTAFAIGAAIAGLAGALYAATLSLVSPDQFQFSVSILVLAMLVLGGMGNLLGVAFGSLFLTTLNSWMLPHATNLAHSVGLMIDCTQYRQMFAGVILVAVMLCRPEGIFPNRRRRAELHR